MSRHISGLRVTIAEASMSAARRSVESASLAFEHALELATDLAEQVRLRGVVDPFLDGGDLFVVEPVGKSAGIADEIGLRIIPNELYLGVVSAIERETGACCVIDHGWPILSVGDRNSTVTEAGVGATFPGGGAA